MQKAKDKRQNLNKGIIQFLVIVLLSVIVLSLLGVSLSSLFNDKTLRENFVFLWHWVVYVWDTYIAHYARQLWDMLPIGR